MIKILDFVPYYPLHIGGLEKHAIELHEKLTKKNMHVTVFTPNLPVGQDDITNENGVIVIRYPAFEIVHNFPFPKFWSLKFWRMFFSLFRKNFDIIFSITMFFHSASLALIYSKIKRKKWIHIEHASDYTKSDSKLISIAARIYTDIFGRITLKFSDLNITPSQSAKKFVSRFTKKPSVVIYRGMPFEEIKKIIPDVKLKEKFPDKKIILYVGRLISGKGIIDLVQAIAKVNFDNFILLVVGDGPEEKKLKELSKNLKIENKILFLGAKYFDEVLSIMKISDIFVNPSYNEGLPTTILEAGICGCGIVATDVGGTKEIIMHNKSGILIEPKNIQKMAFSIERLLKNENETKNFANSAKREIFEKFNWEKSVKSYIKEIDSLLKK
jgi:glycosyltransferase involved in cell wall biosynthesis